MITYVNTVLVSNLATASIVSAEPTTSDAGKLVILNCDPKAAAADKYISTAAKAAAAKAIKVGLVTSKTITVPGTATQKPVIKWSNIINAADVKCINDLTYAADTEDVITIDFTGLNAGVLTELAKGGKRIIVRLTFKDTPTRYRKWTESYEYVTQAGDTKATIAANIADLINKEWKRARVIADKSTANKVILTAMQYDDDNSVDTINVANKVRFNANIYYTLFSMDVDFRKLFKIKVEWEDEAPINKENVNNLSSNPIWRPYSAIITTQSLSSLRTCIALLMISSVRLSRLSRSMPLAL